MEKVKKVSILKSYPYQYFLPKTSQENQSLILSLISSLQQRKLLTIGINSVNRVIIQKKAKIVIISNQINTEALFEHIILMCKQNSIPIVTISMSNRDMGKKIGLKSFSVAALLDTAPEDILKSVQEFASQII